MAKEDEMIKAKKEYSAKKVEYAKRVVDAMIRNKEAVTPYAVWKKSQLSKSFVYTNPEVKAYIARHRTRKSKYNYRKLNKEDLFMIDDAVKERLEYLEKTNATLRKELTFYKKTSWEELKNQNDILYEQLIFHKILAESLKAQIKELENKYKK